MKKLILIFSFLTIFACTSVVSAQLFQPRPVRSILVTEQVTETSDQQTECGCKVLKCKCLVFRKVCCTTPDGTIQIINERPICRLLKRIEEDKPIQKVCCRIKQLLGLGPNVIIVEEVVEEKES